MACSDEYREVPCIDELQPLTDVISEYISRAEDLIAEQLDDMSTRSAYLNNLTQSFRTEWSDSNIENSSVLINAVSSVWIAARILLDVRAELQTVRTLNCPPAYHMSPAEIDQIWKNSYLLLEAEVAGFCTSKSKACFQPIYIPCHLLRQVGGHSHGKHASSPSRIAPPAYLPCKMVYKRNVGKFRGVSALRLSSRYVITKCIKILFELTR